MYTFKKLTLITPVLREEVYKRYVLKSTEQCKDRIEYMPLYNVTHPTRELNEAIERAETNLIVICHDDVGFWLPPLYVKPYNFVNCLERSLRKVPVWGICGLGGTDFDGELILHPERPTKVMTVDDFVLMLDKRDPLRFDEGFEDGWWHFFAEDISLQANEMGLGTYVLPCEWEHRGSRENESWRGMGGLGGSEECKQRLREKWRGKVKTIYTTHGDFYL